MSLGREEVWGAIGLLETLFCMFHLLTPQDNNVIDRVHTRESHNGVTKKKIPPSTPNLPML